jgi:hypothetical protein
LPDEELIGKLDIAAPALARTWRRPHVLVEGKQRSKEVYKMSWRSTFGLAAIIASLAVGVVRPVVAAASEPNWLIGGVSLKSGESADYVTAYEVTRELVIDIGISPPRFKIKWVTKKKPIIDKDQVTGGAPGKISQKELSFASQEFSVESMPTCTVGTIVAEGLPYEGHLKERGGKFYVLYENIDLNVPVSGSECSVKGTYEIKGNLEGEWNNSTSEIIFPETALEGSTLKTSSEPVLYNGADKFAKCPGMLEVN